MARSKRYKELEKLVDKNKTYQIAEAVALVKKTANTKFDGSVEVHFRLGIDAKKGEQQVRGTVTMPAGTGKTKKIVAFVTEDKAAEAQSAGADVIGNEEIIAKILQTGKIDFEVAVTMPAMMPKLAKIAKILGPKGLMPSPKNETITNDLKKTIGELKKGKVNFKNDDNGNLHAIIGKVSFADDKIIENFNALLKAVKSAKPATAKGVYIQNISLNATMGPGIKVSAS